MKFAAFLATLLTFAATVGTLAGRSQVPHFSPYHGPTRLGPFHIEPYTPLAEMWAVLGRPRTPTYVNCFADRTGHAFIQVDVMAGDARKLTGDVMLSESATCLGVAVTPTAARLDQWKTERGIGLGSTLAAVLDAYGQPTKERTTASDSRALVYNPAQRPVPGPRILFESLVYLAGADDLRAAQIGISDGRVAWISVSRDE